MACHGPLRAASASPSPAGYRCTDVRHGYAVRVHMYDVVRDDRRRGRRLISRFSGARAAPCMPASHADQHGIIMCFRFAAAIASSALSDYEGRTTLRKSAVMVCLGLMIRSARGRGP